LALIDLKSAARNLVKCEYAMMQTGFDQEDLIRTVYNLAQCLHVLCNNLDYYGTASVSVQNDFWVESLSVSDNTPSSGNITFGNFTIHYDGQSYLVAGLVTTVKYIYWLASEPDSILGAASDPREAVGWDDETMFVIIINTDGISDIIQPESEYSSTPSPVGTDFLAKIGTPLNTASRRKIFRPTSERTTEGITQTQTEEESQEGLITIDGIPIHIDGKFITVT